MLVKERLMILQNCNNVVDVSQSSIDSLSPLDQDDINVVLSTLKLHAPRLKENVARKYVNFHIESELKYIDWVKIRTYPLVSTYNMNTSRSVINLTAANIRNIDNANPKDLIALVAYSHICSVLSSQMLSISTDYAIPFADYYTSYLLSIFAKRYGLTGTYEDQIPLFKFLTFLYVFRSFFGIDFNKAVNESSRYNHCPPQSVRIDLSQYDFSSITGYISSLNDSQVMQGISLYRFIDSLIKSVGIINLGMFEDCTRFCSTLFAVNVDGNSLFPITLNLFSQKKFSLVTKIIDSVVKKSLS